MLLRIAVLLFAAPKVHASHKMRAHNYAAYFLDTTLVPLEILHRTFVRFGRFFASERAEVAPPACFWILLA
jgi:hypothetical protein